MARLYICATKITLSERSWIWVGAGDTKRDAEEDALSFFIDYGGLWEKLRARAIKCYRLRHRSEKLLDNALGLVLEDLEKNRGVDEIIAKIRGKFPEIVVEVARR